MSENRGRPQSKFREWLMPAKASFGAEIGALLLAIVSVAVDQFTKRLILNAFDLYDTREIIPGVLNFTYVANRGAAFGMLQNHRWVFMSVTSAVIAVAVVLLALRKIRSNLLVLALGLVVGGGIGNMIDRVGRGYVVDFIDLRFVRFYVFNVADCCVVVGAFLMMGWFLWESIQESRAAKRGEETEPMSGDEP